MQELWKIAWRFLKKLKTEVPYYLAIPLLGLDLENIRIQNDTCVRWAWRRREWARQSGWERFIIGRKKVTGFREKPVLSLYSQPCLVYLQLGSCDHGSHRQWSCLAPAGKNRISALKKEQDAHQGNVATVTSYLVCQVTTMGILHCPLWGPCGPDDMHPGLQGSTVYNSQDTGLIYNSQDLQQQKNEDRIVHLYTGGLLSLKKTWNNESSLRKFIKGFSDKYKFLIFRK